MRCCRLARPATILILAMVSTPASSAVIEEVLAVVDNTPILASDIALADAVRLVPAGDGESRAAHASRTLRRRIDLELQFRDLEGSGALHRLELDPEATLHRLAERAGGEEATRRRLDELGLKWSDLRSLSLRVAAVHAYVEQRLRPRVSVSLEEVEAAYRSELGVAPPPPSDDDPVSMAQLASQIHRLLFERKLNGEIEAWLEEARERHEVTRFAP